MNMKLSRYHVVSQPVFDELDGYTKRVLFSTRTSSTCVVDEISWQNIEEGNFEQLPRKILLELIDMEFLIPEIDNELNTILDRNIASAEDMDYLYIVIQPTASCQLGCDYCGQEHSSKLLGEKDQKLLLQRIRAKLENNKQFRKLSICWFGGEPLLGLSVMRSLTPQLIAITEELGCDYVAKLVTNGLALSRDLVTELVDYLKVRHIEITLDGVAEYHDARRHRKDGEPTFNKIFANVIALAYRREELNIRLSLRCNVDRRNYKAVSPLIRTLADAGVQEQLEFYATSVYSWGNEAHELALTPDEFASWEINWLSELTQFGFKLSLLPNQRPVVCLAVMPKADVVDAYGSVFNCTEVSYVPTYGKPNKYELSHLSSEEIPSQREVLGSFNEQIRLGNHPCFSCEMLPVCGGACPKKWSEGLKPCPSFKYNIKQRLLLTYAKWRVDQEKSSTNLEKDEVCNLN